MSFLQRLTKIQRNSLSKFAKKLNVLSPLQRSFQTTTRNNNDIYKDQQEYYQTQKNNLEDYWSELFDLSTCHHINKYNYPLTFEPTNKTQTYNKKEYFNFNTGKKFLKIQP